LFLHLEIKHSKIVRILLIKKVLFATESERLLSSLYSSLGDTTLICIDMLEVMSRKILDFIRFRQITVLA